MSELALLHDEWIGTGFRAFRTRDDGRTWSDESSQVPKFGIPFRDTLGELIVIGDQLLAVSNTRLYRSARGSAWSVVETPAPADGAEPTTLHLALSAGIVHLAVGHALFASRDGGQSWTPAPAKLPGLQGLFASAKSLFGYVNVGSGVSLMRSLDQGKTWKNVEPKLRLREDESLTYFTALGRKVYAATTQGAVLVSSDEGEHYNRRALAKGPPQTVAYRLWPIEGGVLASTSAALLRLGDDGSITRVYPRDVKALASEGAKVVALTAGYLARSHDGGRSFSEERTVGLGNDVVRNVTARGVNIGIMASGPTLFLSSDGGETFAPGPDVSGGAEVVASDGGFYVSTKLEKRATVLEVLKAGDASHELTGRDFGEYPPHLFGTDGEGLAMFVWSRGEVLVSHDHGRTFAQIPANGLSVGGADRGLLHGSELLISTIGGMYRSEGGGPLVPKVFSREISFGHGPLFRDGDTTYSASPSLYAWDEKTDRVESLTLNLTPPLDKDSYIDHAFARGASLLVHVKYPNTDGLFFSADRGRSWRALERPVPDTSVNGFAPSDNGVVVATTAGLWLLPLPR